MMTAKMVGSNLFSIILLDQIPIECQHDNMFCIFPNNLSISFTCPGSNNF